MAEVSQDDLEIKQILNELNDDDVGLELKGGLKKNWAFLNYLFNFFQEHDLKWLLFQVSELEDKISGSL